MLPTVMARYMVKANQFGSQFELILGSIWGIFYLSFDPMGSNGHEWG